jgi:hypothetical protein
MIPEKGADSSDGGASALQAEGHRFKPCSAHHRIFETVANRILLHKIFLKIPKKTQGKYLRRREMHPNPVIRGWQG